MHLGCSGVVKLFGLIGVVQPPRSNVEASDRVSGNFFSDIFFWVSTGGVDFDSEAPND